MRLFMNRTARETALKKTKKGPSGFAFESVVFVE